MNFSLYNKDTGVFVGRTFSGPDRSIVDVLPEGLLAYEGSIDHTKYRIDLASGELVDYVPEVDVDQLDRDARTLRDSLLRDCDWVVLRSIDHAESIPNAWIIYRQELRDITLQSNYPRDIAWPARPA